MTLKQFFMHRILNFTKQLLTPCLLILISLQGGCDSCVNRGVNSFEFLQPSKGDDMPVLGHPSVSHPRLFNVPALPQDNFNQLAKTQNLPFQIATQLENPAGLKPSDLKFTDSSQKDVYVKDGAFTPEFEKAYKALVEKQRRASVETSLAEGREVIMEADLTGLPREERLMISHLKVVARKIEELHMKQQGTYQYVDDVEELKATHPASFKLFWRNQSPWALAPKTANDPFASALPTFPQKHPGIYPADAQINQEFLDRINEDPELGHQWTVVVRDESGELKGVRYYQYYAQEMQEIAEHLDQAAHAIKGTAGNESLYEYLTAAAQAFRNGDWDAADAKWVAMNMQNSKYALRVAPDETYWDPGNMKAGFEFWFARIDQDAAEFSKQIAPYFPEMEKEIKNLVPLYDDRQIEMESPDFIEMLYRAGDHRSDLGATIGQKLPNFNDAFSRMVVMTNYYTDPQSQADGIEKAKLLLAPENVQDYQPEKVYSTANTYLHEATHSLGPQADVMHAKNPDGSLKTGKDGQPVTMSVALGGANSQVMEELKAQTGDLHWINFLTEKGVLTTEQRNKMYRDAVLWAFGHISRGMLQGDGSPRTYSQLAAIQIRELMNAGAITYENDRFKLHFNKFPAAIEKMFVKVVTIQVTGDRDAANAWRQDVIDGEGYDLIHAKEVRERLSRFPTASFDLQMKLE